MKKIAVSLLAAFLLLAGCILVLLAAGFGHTSSRRLKNMYKGSVEPAVSGSDMDQDGTDDQTDILEGALAYVETEPKYKSKYYASGYPDDEYGVCTDVVAYALRSAGYDLRSLMDEDIKQHPGDYDIDVPDDKIDFRRVKNQKVYFDHTALSLTLDLAEIEEWQGGDIVVFKNHVGIVSDHRNKRGVPYVIHHNSPAQRAYEEDILEKRDDIVGHYRVEDPHQLHGGP